MRIGWAHPHSQCRKVILFRRSVARSCLATQFVGCEAQVLESHPKSPYRKRYDSQIMTASRAIVGVVYTAITIGLFGLLHIELEATTSRLAKFGAAYLHVVDSC